MHSQGQGAFVVNPQTRGLDGHDMDTDAWVSHRGSTLFAQGTDDVWTDLWNHLYHKGRILQGSREHHEGFAKLSVGMRKVQPGSAGELWYQ